jgi:hypothetical protein
MQPPTPIPETPAPPGAIPAEKLLPGLRGELQKNEHVLWQGRGSGRAFNALSRALMLRLVLLALAAAAAAWLMLDTRGGGYGWVVWVLMGLLLLRVGWFIWQSSATPARQVAMLTTQRVVSVDMLRPTINWEIRQRGEGRADGKHAAPHAIVVTGTKARGHIRLNRAPQNTRAYPPYILFNAERPLEVAELIKTTQKIDQPIEDKTK